MQTFRGSRIINHSRGTCAALHASRKCPQIDGDSREEHFRFDGGQHPGKDVCGTTTPWRSHRSDHHGMRRDSTGWLTTAHTPKKGSGGGIYRRLACEQHRSVLAAAAAMKSMPAAGSAAFQYIPAHPAVLIYLGVPPSFGACSAAKTSTTGSPALRRFFAFFFSRFEGAVVPLVLPAATARGSDGTAGVSAGEVNYFGSCSSGDVGGAASGCDGGGDVGGDSKWRADNNEPNRCSGGRVENDHKRFKAVTSHLATFRALAHPSPQPCYHLRRPHLQ